MAIVLQNATFSYAEEGKPVLEKVSARFERDQITVLTGASGCGKSTLLTVAAGLYPHNAGFLSGGSVTVEGITPGDLPPPERCALVGMMFQNPELQFCMDTVENELIFCLENRRTPPEEIPAAVNEALAFSGIEHLRRRRLATLSGGERQKAALACIAALSPAWLLLDEPFANIDGESAAAIAQKLLALHRSRGTGILAVEHRLDWWQGIADEVRILDGNEVGPGIPMENLPAEELEARGVTVPNRPYLSPRPPHRTPGKPALSLQNLSLSYGENQVLKNTNAVFDSGRVHAIVGESGSGKSSLFGAITGQVRFSGRININSCINLYDCNPFLRQSSKIGFVTQSPQDQFVADTVQKEILTGLRKLRPVDAKVRAEEILRSIRLWRYRDVSPYRLSQGQQRRLGVAALLAYDCRVLLCDEPTYAQDRRSTLSIMEGLCKHVDENGLCLIFSTHDKQLAADYADVVWELRGGELHAISESGL